MVLGNQVGGSKTESTVYSEIFNYLDLWLFVVVLVYSLVCWNRILRGRCEKRLQDKNQVLMKGIRDLDSRANKQIVKIIDIALKDELFLVLDKLVDDIGNSHRQSKVPKDKLDRCKLIVQLVDTGRTLRNQVYQYHCGSIALDSGIIKLKNDLMEFNNIDLVSCPTSPLYEMFLNQRIAFEKIKRDEIIYSNITQLLTDKNSQIKQFSLLELIPDKSSATPYSFNFITSTKSKILTLKKEFSRDEHPDTVDNSDEEFSNVHPTSTASDNSENTKNSIGLCSLMVVLSQIDNLEHDKRQCVDLADRQRRHAENQRLEEDKAIQKMKKSQNEAMSKLLDEKDSILKSIHKDMNLKQQEINHEIQNNHYQATINIVFLINVGFELLRLVILQRWLFYDSISNFSGSNGNTLSYFSILYFVVSNPLQIAKTIACQIKLVVSILSLLLCIFLKLFKDKSIFLVMIILAISSSIFSVHIDEKMLWFWSVFVISVNILLMVALKLYIYFVPKYKTKWDYISIVIILYNVIINVYYISSTFSGFFTITKKSSPSIYEADPHAYNSFFDDDL
ncbi:hypothetical protein DLAC_01323 [Tieghemostelium lacteum]|uniref:Uncharacterized protein n=1 Tax=Tieghemostelium lacteum TaxID=361077 RepID=A0A152A8C4_TIELA|nr:hypothetical protein DLAC_01323 [Tieghemostelium lacteum]|eukprot:KYR02483.1 hypothetical protein DLAC_01323 [Tieghemostelium lacteum]